MKKVLVTGGAGFMGSFLLRELAKNKNNRVTATYHGDESPTKEIKKLAQFIQIDLTDQAKTHRLIKGFDYVIHLAALVQGYGRYHDAPATTLSENLIIDVNVIRSAALHRVKKLVYTSSHEVLRAFTDQPKKLDEKIVDGSFPFPENAYSFSKLVGERLCKAYQQEFGLPYVIVYNLSYDYGVLATPRNARGYMPRVVSGITKAKQKKSGWIPWYIEVIQTILTDTSNLVFRGDPKRKRYWTHWADTARGIVLAMESKKLKNESLFLTSDEQLTSEEFVKTVFAKMRPGEKLQAMFTKSKRLPSLYHIPDTSKAKRMLGWKAEHTLENSLDEIIAWVKNEFPKPQ